MAIRAIMSRQMDQDELAGKCDYVIVNNDEIPVLPQIMTILDDLNQWAAKSD